MKFKLKLPPVINVYLVYNDHVKIAVLCNMCTVRSYNATFLGKIIIPFSAFEK